MRGIEWIFLIFISAVAGCTGEILETRRRLKGPVPEVAWIDPGGGHARYSNRGAKWVVENRRRDTLLKIAAYCKDTGYKIIDEMERSETEVPYTADPVEESVGHGDSHYRKAGYHHIYFECVPSAR